MKTQEEYAYKIGEIVLRDVESCQSDWFLIDQEIFMLPETGTRHLFWEPGRPDVI